MRKQQTNYAAAASTTTERAVSTAWIGIAALAVIAGCARTSVEHDVKAASAFPRPKTVVVHDFTISAHDVVLDSGVRARLQRALSETPDQQQVLQVEQEVTRILTDNLVKEIDSLGIPAVSATAALPSSADPVLDIEGQIVSIDEGNQTQRMVLGLGRGASEVRNLVQVYQRTPGGRRLVEDFYVTVKSSLKPGVGVAGGAGAQVQRAAQGAETAAGVGALAARSQTVEADASNAAKQIAQELKKLYQQQGWI